jgi:anti-sigma factor (TIGR02949 family)
MAPSPSAPSDAHDPSSGDAVHHPPAGHDHAATSSECDEAVAEIYAFLDGELDDTVMIQVEAHLRRCSPCLEAFDFEADLRRVIAAKCTEEVTPEIKARFCGLLRQLSDGGPDAAGVSSPGSAS